MDEPTLRVIHADEGVLVLDKPGGLLSVPGRGPDKQDCLATRAQAAFPDALVVHRLDMATSGLMLMARGAAAQSALSASFAAGEVSKHYVAVVAGHPSSASDAQGWSLIDLPIAADWPRRPLHVIDPERGKPSRTLWRILSRTESTTRLELRPLTGRTHQLRVHLQALGHPILGDTLYAPPELQALSPRLLLHASQIVFPHPLTGAAMAFMCNPAF